MRPSTLFLYSLVITVLAFIYRDPLELAFIAVPNISLGLVLGVRRFRLLLILFVIGYLGLFINTLIVVNRGEEVFSIGPLIVREEALNAFISIGLRLLAIAGATMIFLSLIDPYRAVKSLENDLRLPKGISFSIYYALRLLPYLEKVVRDIRDIRRMRGYRGFILTPMDFASILRQLLSLLVERAIWTGIAMELRGFSLRRVRREPIKLDLGDYIVLLAALTQIITPLLLL